MNTQEIINWLRADADFIDADTYDECWEVEETPRGKTLRAAASRLSEMDAALRAQEWQDIETAPRDGTPILAVDADGEIAVVANKWIESRQYYTGWYAPIYDMSCMNPTHWRSLPTPPAHDKGEPQP